MINTNLMAGEGGKWSFEDKWMRDQLKTNHDAHCCHINMN